MHHGKAMLLLLKMLRKTAVRKNILIDTGFWIALYNTRDQYHENANEIIELIRNENILIPWPTLYEFLNTRFVKDPRRIEGFAIFVKKSVTLIDDAEYRAEAFNIFFGSFNKKNRKTLSLVDLIIREILTDTSLKIDYLATFNSGDFADVCQRRQIEIL